MNIKKLQEKVNETFLQNFGRTSLNERLKDILGEVIELQRFTDIRNLKEEAGDLLSSLLQLFNENEWNPAECVQATLDKIERRKLQYQTLGRKTKVALLGGAFNPIHNGHIELARAVLNWSKTFDEVWLLPCYQHINGKELVDAQTRLEWCKLAASVDGRIKVCDYEIKHQLKGETFHFVKRLLDEDFAKHEYDFSMIIGLDNANTFDKWVNYEYLEKMIRFVVVPRQGEVRDPSVNWYLKEPHIYLHPEEPISEISSTQIRVRFKTFYRDKTEEYFLQNNLSDNVFNSIRNGGYYK